MTAGKPGVDMIGRIIRRSGLVAALSVLLTLSGGAPAAHAAPLPVPLPSGAPWCC